MNRLRRLLLLRHGLPDYSLRKAGDEPPGPPLSSTGVSQIRQAIPVLRRLAPVALYSSPLARARQCAALVADTLRLPVQIDSDLKEWHRTERLYQVNERSARWLRRWLERDEPCAAVFGHASPLLSILRTALFLPHCGWWRGDNTERLALNTCDRFEVSMGSLFEIVFEPDTVTARCMHHPQPRIVSYTRRRGVQRSFARPTMTGENLEVRRPNFGRLIGYRGT
jgi:broad specificity phosphatase PhoE